MYLPAFAESHGVQPVDKRMYLLDTNIWLERLLEQKRALDVSRFLAAIPESELAITDFAFHSIGVIMLKLGKPT